MVSDSHHCSFQHGRAVYCLDIVPSDHGRRPAEAKMVTEAAPSQWLDLFTEETWLEAARHGFSVSGFTEGRWTTVRRIQPGDLLVCYLTGRSAYVGLLRVTGDPYQDATPIWARQVFPSRLPVRL